MNAGDGETGYANNSGTRRLVNEHWSLFDKTLQDMFTADNYDFPKCMKMVHLGCSSGGANTLLVISHIIEELSKQKHAPREIQVFLNDLPDNDFNNLLKQLPNFSQKNNDRKIECFVYGAPGSFYGRLFPTNSLHFAYSSYSLHWLSQTPEGLGKKNNENIYITRTSPREVFEAYSKQFQKDFSRFLNLRGEEIRVDGRMVLVFLGRFFQDPSSRDEFQHFTLLAETLSDMVTEGFLREDDLHSFNMPFYAPSTQEIRAAIRAEGSFGIDKMEGSGVIPWDFTNKDSLVTKRFVKHMTETIRTFMEPMLAAHFGRSVDIDFVFDAYAMKIAERSPLVRQITHVFSLTRKLITDLK